MSSGAVERSFRPWPPPLVACAGGLQAAALVLAHATLSPLLIISTRTTDAMGPAWKRRGLGGPTTHRIVMSLPRFLEYRALAPFPNRQAHGSVLPHWVGLVWRAQPSDSFCRNPAPERPHLCFLIPSSIQAPAAIYPLPVRVGLTGQWSPAGQGYGRSPYVPRPPQAYYGWKSAVPCASRRITAEMRAPPNCKMP